MKNPFIQLACLGIGCSALVGAPLDLKLDEARAGAPINPFVYGQFVEHLGRCVYGGIWAEMLEDRKFYFPVSADYAPYKELVNTDYPVVGASPWQITGEVSGVSMSKGDAFVGEHSPRINAGSGIRQRDLGLVAGKNYSGYIWAKPLARHAEIEVALVWGGGPSDRSVQSLSFDGEQYTKQPVSFTSVSGGERIGVFEVRVLSGDVLLGPPSLMPSDNVEGLRADTLALLKQLGGTIYRWPGGNFVSGYNWRDGIGARDRRPPRRNPAWTGIEHNDFGTDEFIAFCRMIETEPMIAVNTGFGDDYSAAQWVEYCNRGEDTIAGAWRAGNGFKKPYGVKYWCVGNEMFGPWQLGFMQMHHYTLKNNLFADAMRKADPNVVLTAVGDLNTINKHHDPEQAKSGKTCSHIMLEQCADHLDLLSEHFYEGRLPQSKTSGVPLYEHVALLKNAIRLKAEGHRKLQASLPNLKGRVVPIAMDEWNYWHREYVFGELGCVYDMADGLGVAAGLHEYFRQSDIIHMAHYAQTVNVIGAIKTSRTAAEMETTGLILQLYRHHFGRIPLKFEHDFGPCDVAAALTDNRSALTIGVVNPTGRDLELHPSLAGATLARQAALWCVGAASADVHNTPGSPRSVDIRHTDAVDVSTSLRAPALSVSLFRIPL